MAINFPATPTDGQLHTTDEGTVYQYVTATGAWIIKAETISVDLGPAFAQANTAYNTNYLLMGG